MSEYRSPADLHRPPSKHEHLIACGQEGYWSLARTGASVVCAIVIVVGAVWSQFRPAWSLLGIGLCPFVLVVLYSHRRAERALRIVQAYAHSQRGEDG